MAIRDAEGKKYSAFSEGVDDTTVIDSPEIAGSLSKALNADLVTDSICKKRNGYTPVNTAWGTRRVTQGFDFKKTDGSREILVYGQDSSITGTSGILGKLNGSGVPTTIISGLRDGIKPCIVQFRSTAFLFNGQDSILYDGTSTRQIGIDPPSTAPTLNHVSYNFGVSTGTEPFPLNSSFVFVYTYYNSVTGAESSPSDPSSSIVFDNTVATGGTHIFLNLIAGNSTTADKIRVYRTVNGGSVFFLDGETSVSSTSYDSTVLDSGLGNELELDNSRLTEQPLFGLLNGDNRLIVGGFSSNPNRLQYSKVGINGPMPESFQVADFVDCNINDGDKILGLGQAGDNVIVIKERSVGKLISINSQGSGLERSGSQKYIYEQISTEVTGLSHHCIVSLDGLVIWLGRDEVFGTNGVEIFRFGKRIRNTLLTFNLSQISKFSCTNKTDTKQIIFSVCRNSQTEPDFQLVGHYRNFPKIAWTYYSPGTDTSTHPGLIANSFFPVVVNNVSKWYFGSSAANGLVYQMDTGSSDNGSAIYWDVRLPWDGQNNPAAQKLFHSYYIFGVGTGVSPNNTLTHTFEKDLIESISVTKVATLPGSNTNWTAANWNAFNWATLTFGPLRFFPHKRAYFGRYGFNNIYADQPCAILAVTKVAQVFPIHR